MQKKERCILSLGSNTDASLNLTKARALLCGHFPDIRFSTPLRTAPIGMSNPSLFTNQTAVFRTPLPQAEVKSLLKTIEAACAQPPKDKANGLIHIDIDLLTYGQQTLKPADMKREYLISGMEELGVSTTSAL